MTKPKIVVLCGSTRFVDIFNEYRVLFTHQGRIVLSIEIVTSQTEKTDPQLCNSELKQRLDELHLRKIDLADEVFVINKDGYIGESTSREIAYARSLNKPITYLEQWQDDRPSIDKPKAPVWNLTAFGMAELAKREYVNAFKKGFLYEFSPKQLESFVNQISQEQRVLDAELYYNQVHKGNGCYHFVDPEKMKEAIINNKKPDVL